MSHLPRITNLSAPSPPEEVLDSFLGLDGFSLAVRASKFSQQELVSKLILHIRDPDPRNSLAATRQLWAITKDIALINGRITKATLSESSNEAPGQVRTRTLHSLTRPAPFSGASGALVHPSSSDPLPTFGPPPPPLQPVEHGREHSENTGGSTPAGS